jgi:cyanophycin synthetase
MFDPTRSRRALRLLAFWERVKGKLSRKHTGEQEADQQLADFYNRIWREAADQVGASVQDLGGNVLEIRLGERRTRVWQNCSAIDDLATHHIVRMKGLMYRLLAGHGLPVPRHLEFTLDELKQAADFLDSSRRPCVVKPACGTGGGVGVVTNIRTHWQLARAAWRATIRGDHPLIEEQVEGSNYRILYLDGELLDVVKREPPAVIGDGKSTVLELAQQANRARIKALAAAAAASAVSHSQMTLDQDMQMTLARQGLSLRSVPAAGALVQLKTAINENSSRDNVTAIGELCPDLLDEAARAARLSGLRLAGVDVITADPRRSLRDSGGVILEVNSPPGYFWHYHKRDGCCPVAVHVLRALFELPDEIQAAGAAQSRSTQAAALASNS